MGILTREVESLVLGCTWDETKAPILSTALLCSAARLEGQGARSYEGNPQGPASSSAVWFPG